MFDYEKFEHAILGQMTAVFNKWAEEKEDLYIFSLDCTRNLESIGVIGNTISYLEEQAEEDSEDYWYYKYCEEEWELFDTFEAVSADMGRYLEEQKNTFSNPETLTYSDAFDAHFDQIIDHCKHALLRFRQTINENYPHILLTFNVREFWDSEERAEIFQAINDENASKEYSEHIEDFA